MRERQAVQLLRQVTSHGDVVGREAIEVTYEKHPPGAVHPPAF